MHGPTHTIESLLNKIRIVKDTADEQSLLQSLAPSSVRGPVRVAFVNAHALNMCHTDPAFLGRLMECDYVFRDGAGMKILYKMLGREPGLNMNGTDFIPKLLELYKGQSVALFGTDSPYLDRAAEKITAQGLNVSLSINGFHEAGIYVQRLKEKPVTLTVLAMGMPKQEHVAAMIARDIPTPNLIVCGGAILDFIGEKVARAPEIFRKTGMEWFYRLAQEPTRLFNRYVIGNFTFMGRAVKIARRGGKAEEGAERSGKLRVLHVVRQYAPAIGGLESYVHSMTAHQKALGYDCEVLTLNKIFHGDAAELPAEEIIDGIKVRRVGFWGRRRFFIPKISPFYFTRFDIVHVHNTDCFYDYVALVSAFTGTKSVATTHGGFFHTNDFSLIKKIYFNTITRVSSMWYETIFAISGNDYDMFKGLNKNIVLQPNAVEPLGNDISQGPDFLYIGRLAQHKHVARVVEVFSHLKNTHNIAGKLHIIGPEWDVTLDSLRAAATQFNVAESVEFHGAATRSDMQNIAQQCGYFLSASSFEGFGMSMLEGMTVGMIPFVEGNESFTELVSQSGIGLCVRYADAHTAASEIAALLPTVTDDTRFRAQAFARTFSWDELAWKTARAYEQTVSA
jgi:alpha-1,3-mannosyltransferase